MAGGRRGRGRRAGGARSRKRAEILLRTAQNRPLLGKIGQSSCSNYLAVQLAFSYFIIKICILLPKNFESMSITLLRQVPIILKQLLFVIVIYHSYRLYQSVVL